MSVNFNAGSATTYGKNSLVFGGNDGAVRFPIDIQIPEPHYSRLLLRDFMIAYHPVYPGDDGSPLQKILTRPTDWNWPTSKTLFH